MCRRLVEITRRLIGVVQKRVLAALLALLYVFGFGVTKVLARVLDRRLLGRGAREATSYWVDAEDYGPDLDQARHQS